MVKGTNLLPTIQTSVNFVNVEGLYFRSLKKYQSQLRRFYLFYGALSSSVDGFSLFRVHVKNCKKTLEGSILNNFVITNLTPLNINDKC